MIYFIWILCCFCCLLAICLIRRRERCKRKVRQMPQNIKTLLLNELIEPYGFLYEPDQDIFVSQIDAWQRKEGYEALFDNLAVNFNMVMDLCPVYFDYRGKTWLIEFWKGQYGINTGAEVGVYHTNRLIPKKQRRKVHYNAVSDEEMPQIGMRLERRGEKFFCLKKFHWWLAAFCMGTFSEPKELVLYVSITFSDCEAAQAFGEGLQEAGFLPCQYKTRGRRVTVVFDAPTGQKLSKCAIIHRKLVQKCNQFYCWLYRFATRPFCTTVDRMLFLYEQLPWCFRRMLRLHSFGRKARVKK